MKKKMFLIITIITVVFLTGLLFILFKNTDKLILKDDKFIFEFGDDISSEVSYYLKDADSVKNIKDYKLISNNLKIVDNKLVNNNSDMVEVGKYSINISYKKISKDVQIEVVDTISPEFTKFQEVIEMVQTTEEVDLTSHFEATDLSEVVLKVEGEYNLNEVGEYTLNIVATDSSENTSKREFVLKILKNEIPKEEPKKENNKNTQSKVESNNNVSSNNQSNSGSASNNNTPSSRYRKDISDSYVRTVNSYRKSNGLSELPVTAEAQAEADRRAKELCSYYSHDGAGYGFGEIIGNGSIGGDFITAWKNSPPHNATMLREQAIAMAASVYECNNYWYAIISFRMNY